LKETAKSLRAYFFLAGLFSAYSNVRGLMGSPGVLILGFDVLGLVLAAGFLYVGAVLPTLLAQAPERINLLLAITAGVGLVGGGLLLLQLGPSLFGIIVVAVQLAICAYLYVNVKRLSA
jgi:hypothetical protein